MNLKILYTQSSPKICENKSQIQLQVELDIRNYEVTYKTNDSCLKYRRKQLKNEII